MKNWTMLVLLLVAGCDFTASSETRDLWVVTELDRDVAQVLNEDGTCMRVFGMEVGRSDDPDQKLLLLSWSPFSDSEWQVNDSVRIDNLPNAPEASSFGGIWVHELSIVRVPGNGR